MALHHSPRIVKNGLVLCLDAANVKSYPGSGTTWTDLVSASTTGSLLNGTAYSSVNSGVMVFDGTNDRITVTNSLPSLSQLTIEVWLKTDVVDSTQNIFLDQYISLRYEITSNNKFNIHLGGGSSWIYTFLPSSTTVVAGVWYQTVWTWNGSVANIFVNGIKENSISNSAASSGTGAITLGQHTPDTNNAWAGSLGCVKIYNIGLSDLEVYQNFQALRGRYGI